MDTLTPRERSERMSLVRGKDTSTEMVVRRIVHGLGFRYRLHARDLPGKPDMVFRSRRKIIFVHGCFWHRHAKCALARIPKSRHDFWIPKLEGNRLRDIKNRKKLRTGGWDVMTIWECELRDHATMTRKVLDFLSSSARERV